MKQMLDNNDEKPATAVMIAAQHFSNANEALLKWLALPPHERAVSDLEKVKSSQAAGLTTLRIWMGEIYDRPYKQVLNELSESHQAICYLNGRTFLVNSVRQESQIGMIVRAANVVSLQLIDFGGKDKDDG